jgi:hypothetical protein
VLEKPVHNTAKQLGIANFIVGEELLIEDGSDINAQDDDSSYSDYNDEDELFNFIINQNI